MPNTREKLIELLKTPCDYAGCEWDCTQCLADHLIANGVTFAKDNNVPSKWIPVTERLPERGIDVLVCDTREDYVSVWEYMGDELWYGEEIIWATEDITHWMPLPEPPKGE